MFSYGNLLFVAAGLMIFVTISAVLAWEAELPGVPLFCGRAHCDHPTLIAIADHPAQSPSFARLRASRRFKACSCPGFWYRKTCRHYRAYRDAVSLVLAQDVFNQAWSSIPVKLTSMVSEAKHRYLHTLQVSVFHRSWDCLRSRSLGFGLSTVLGMMAAPQGREGMSSDVEGTQETNQ